MMSSPRGVKRVLIRSLHKLGNIIVALMLLLQPVGTPGVWNIALAQSTDPNVLEVDAAASSIETEDGTTEDAALTGDDATATVTSTEEEPMAIGEEEGVILFPDEAATTEGEPLTPEAEAAEVIDEGLSEKADETIVTSDAGVPPTEDVSDETTTIIPAETTSSDVIEPLVSEETESAEALPAIMAEEVPSVKPVNETTCLAASVTESGVNTWKVEGDRAVTKDVVELGVRYVFPLDEEVTITFTCLPTDESKRAPLSIERINAAEITLPGGVAAATDYAYDIKTEGMDNGDFKYDLTLPKADTDGTEVKYIEQTAKEVVASVVTEKALKSVDEDKVEVALDSITVSELDHFTVFIVTVNASKIVCTNEADLPNYGLGGPDITSTTATDWVATHKSCSLVPDWEFQWSYDGTPHDGDQAFDGGAGWTTFGVTNSSGVVSTDIINESGNDRLWFREKFQDGYIPFTLNQPGGAGNANDVSAEFYCHDDVLNYDNWDWIDSEPGGTYYCVAWNAPVFVEPELIISKSNNKDPEVQEPGNVVTYTITVTAPKGNETEIDDVTVTDLPPEGFEYVSGSAVASAGSGLTTTYASPGVWSLGTMTPGQVVTLTYETVISGVQDAGTYKDLAWAKGKSVSGATVLAADPVDPDNATGDNYVGTKVAVNVPTGPTEVALNVRVERDVDTDTERRVKRVLGASTLPATGAETGWVTLALVFITLGIGLLIGSRRWRRKASSEHLILAVIVSAGLFVGGASAQAAEPIVKIETPDTPIATTPLEVGFVTLDIEDRMLDAQCYQEDGAVDTAVTTLYTAKNGGNSGSCTVTSTAMPSDGTYQFYVQVTYDEGGSINSDLVTVELVSNAPSTPVSYSRSSCTVSYTTANDALTTGVELHRSTATSFVANSSTKVTTVAVAHNSAGTITDPNANCGNDYYYAIRAVAANGNVSGFVGDEGVTIDKENKKKYVTDTKQVKGGTSGAIPVTATGGAAVTTTPTTVGVVEGAATTAEETTPVTPEKEGSVLGDATEAVADGLGDWIKAHPLWSVILLLVLLTLGNYGYGKYQEKRHDESIQ